MRIFKIFLSLIALIMLAVIIWGTNRGFDLTDEAYYMIGFNQKQVIFYQNTYFWLPVKFMFQWLELNVLAVRVIRLILTLTSGLILSYGFLIWLKSIKYFNIEFILIFAVVLIGNLGSYSVLPQSLSYNSLNSNYQNISVGLLLFALPQKNKYISIISFILIGFIIPFQIITKITSGFLNFFCIILVLMFYKLSLNDFKKIFVLISFISGVLLGFLMYFVFIQNIHDYLDGIIEYAKQTNVPYAYNYDTQFFRFLKPFKDIILNVLPFYLFWLIVIYIYKKWISHSEKKIIKFINILLTSIFILSFFYVFYFAPAKKTTFVFFGIISFVVIFIIYDLMHEKIYIKSLKNELIVMLFILIIPFVVAFGSSDNVWYGSYFSLSMWFMFIFWSIYLSNRKLLMKISLLTASITCLILFINGYIFTPYRIKPLTEQKITVENNNVLKGIMVDDETHQLIKDVNKIIKGTTFHKGDPVIILGTYPGFACLVEGVQYCDVIWSTDEYFSKKCIEKQSKYLEKPIIFTSDDYDLSLSRNYLHALKENGVEFPEKYSKIGSVIFRREKISFYEFQNVKIY